MQTVEAIVPTQRLFDGDAYRTQAEARVVDVTPHGVILDQTIFYAESGGQPGDTGYLELPDGRRVKVLDTRYMHGKLRILHCLEEKTDFYRGQSIGMYIDWPRRYSHMRMHSCLHVLCGLVNAPVTGCSIHANRGRLDFDLPENQFTKEELDRRLRKEILRDRPVRPEIYTGPEVAVAMDATRTTKPPPPTQEHVRVIEIDGLDLQPCGGTHVRTTGELEGLTISRIQKKGRHNRRITVQEKDI